MDPLVSVIILCYNQQDTIARAIDSVLEQKTDFPFEIILADDASADSTRDVCLRYRDSFPDKIKLLPERPNRGIVLNYFEAFAACSGEFIADCSGDDYWCNPSKLQVAVDMLRKDSSANVVFSDFYIHNLASGERRRAYDSPEYVRWKKPRLPRRELLCDLLNHVNAIPYMLSAAVYRKRVIDKALEVVPDLVCNPAFNCEDIPVIAALARSGDALFHPDPTLVYIVGDETVSNSLRPERRVRFYTGVLNCTFEQLKYSKLPEDSARDMFICKANYLLANCILSDDSTLAGAVLEAVDRWSLSLPLKSRIYRLALAHPFLHKTLRQLKHLLAKLCGIC